MNYTFLSHLFLFENIALHLILVLFLVMLIHILNFILKDNFPTYIQVNPVCLPRCIIYYFTQIL